MFKAFIISLNLSKSLRTHLFTFINSNKFIKKATFTSGLLLSTSLFASKKAYSDKFANSAFYPPIEFYEKNSLKVSDIHTISYTLYGNPNGKPVLVVHGGPGGGTNPDMARYFDPKIYKIILVDQRGCGESTPFANLIDNTTYDSVRDFEKLRKKLGVEKWQVFGGSWGSTLSLAYAVRLFFSSIECTVIIIFYNFILSIIEFFTLKIEHPERVTELVLRGIFLVREKELQWLYQGPGANYLFPEDWTSYEQAIPEEERGDFIAAYGKRLRGEHGEEG
jgi:proline iminopeptidase